MAKRRGRPPGGKAKAKSEPVRPSEVDRIINEKQFKLMMNALDAHTREKDKAVGAKRSVIARAKEKHNVDPVALSMHQRVRRLDIRGAARTLAHFEHYNLISGLYERISEQGDMLGHGQALAEVGPDDIAPRKHRGRPPKNKNGGSVQAVDQEEEAEPLTQREREASPDFDSATTH